MKLQTITLALFATTLAACTVEDADAIGSPEADMRYDASDYEAFVHHEAGTSFKTDRGCVTALNVVLREDRDSSDRIFTQIEGGCFHGTTTIDLVRVSESDPGEGRYYGYILTPEGDSVMVGEFYADDDLPVLWVRIAPDPDKAEIDITIEGMILLPEHTGTDGNKSDDDLRFVGLVTFGRPLF